MSAVKQMVEPVEDRFLNVREVVELTRITRGALAQLRYKKQGPDYFKPTPQIVLYKESDVRHWLEDSKIKTS